jgi:hypothetical protein
LVLTAISDDLLSASYATNILDNGGFEVWQRGTSFTNPGNATFTADRWQITHITPNPVYTITQESSVVDSGLYSLKINVTNFNSTPFLQLLQYREDYLAYAGRTITLSARVWSNATGSQLELASAAGNFAQSANHPGDSQWHTLTVTYTVAAVPTFLFTAFNIGQAGTYYIDSAMLVIGSLPVNYIPDNPQRELSRCQRYYWQLNSNNVGIIATLQCTSTTSAQGALRYPVQMRVSPTITITNVGTTELYTATGGGVGTSSITPGAQTLSCNLTVTVASSLVAGNATGLVPTGPGFVMEFSADV